VFFITGQPNPEGYKLIMVVVQLF